jgi:hypothetical protein
MPQVSFLGRALSRNQAHGGGVPHRRYCSLEIGGKDVIDGWGAMGGGISL